MRQAGSHGRVLPDGLQRQLPFPVCPQKTLCLCGIEESLLLESRGFCRCKGEAVVDIWNYLKILFKD